MPKQPCVIRPFPAKKADIRENVAAMKKVELRGLIDEHLVLRKKIEGLREELKKLEDRYEEVGQLLYWCRSEDFLRSELWYLQDLRKAYRSDQYFDDLVDTVIHSLKDHENIEQRKIYTAKHLLRLFDEKLE
jgi:archaellum component FlaC